MTSPTSLRLRSCFSIARRPAFFSIGTSAKSGGSDGRFSIFHLPRAGSNPSGGAIS